MQKLEFGWDLKWNKMKTYIRSRHLTFNYGRNYKKVEENYQITIKIKFTIGHSLQQSIRRPRQQKV